MVERVRLGGEQVGFEYRGHLFGEVSVVDIQTRFVIEPDRANVEVG